MTKVHNLYKVIAEQSPDGYCEMTYPDLSRLSGISKRHLYRLIPELQDLGLIKTELIHNNRGNRSKTRFNLTGLSDSRSHLGQTLSDSWSHLGDQNSSLSDSGSHLGSPKCHQESLRPALMNHDDDNDKKLNRKLILEALSFLDLPGRLKLLQLPHLNLGYAELARQYVDYLKLTKQWQPKYSAGRVYRLIEQGEIPTQFEMPAGSIELPAEEEKAWYSAEEADLIQR